MRLSESRNSKRRKLLFFFCGLILLENVRLVFVQRALVYLLLFFNWRLLGIFRKFITFCRSIQKGWFFLNEF